MWYRIAIISMAFLAITSKAADIPSEVGWPLRKAYIPPGFDDNDKVQITVAGEFPNTCFRVGPYASKVDEKAKVIFLKQRAYSYSAFCLDILIPFAQTIDVGLVPSGDYLIVDSTTGTQLGRTTINRATNSGPDDYLYPVVDDASIRRVEQNKGKNELVLSLRFTDRCTKLGRVDVHYYADVIVVQPVAVRAGENESQESCAAELTRKEYTQMLPEGLTGGYLLHVRSMNGQAINKLVDLE